MNEFQESALKVPSELRGVQTTAARSAGHGPTGHYYFGVPVSQGRGMTPVHSFPLEIEGVSFLLGGGSKATTLISDFVSSGYSSSVERLTIGLSSCRIDGYPEYRKEHLHYTQIVEKLQGIAFPRLKELHLGRWELFHNASQFYFDVGDVTKILCNCPKLEVLGLYGDFTISKPFYFHRLKKLHLEATDDTGEGRFRPQTFKNILESDFPLLENIYLNSNSKEKIDLQDTDAYKAEVDAYKVNDDEVIYIFPDKFLANDNIPNLKFLEICGEFAVGERQRLLSSDVGSKEGVNYFLDLMVQVYR